jgi:LAS superfamily LD-carboxypeptidase LdcB
MLNDLELTGQVDTHIVRDSDSGSALHPNALEAYFDLRSEAKQAGFELQIASSFRGFEAQLRIWNEKFRGQRKLLDGTGQEVLRDKLSPWQVVQAILL